MPSPALERWRNRQHGLGAYDPYPLDPSPPEPRYRPRLLSPLGVAVAVMAAVVAGYAIVVAILVL